MKSKILFFGDSIVKYKNNSKTNSWASQLIKLIIQKMFQQIDKT